MNVAINPMTGSADPKTTFAQLIKNLNDGQDISAAVTGAEAKGKLAATKGGMQKGPKAKIGQTIKPIDLEKLTLQALLIGLLDKSYKTKLSVDEIKRSLLALKATQSKLKTVFDDGDEAMDAKELALTKAAAKQQSERLKLALKKKTKENITKFDMAVVKKAFSQDVSAILAVLFTQSVDDPNFGFDEASAAMQQLAMQTVANAMQKQTSDMMSDELKQITMQMKSLAKSQAERMMQKVHG